MKSRIATNWSRHLRGKTHLKNDRSQTIAIRRRGRPTTVQLHQVLKFRKSIFEKPNVRTAVRTKESAFRSRLLTSEIINSRNCIDVGQDLNSIGRIIMGNIRREVARNNNLKVIVIVFAEYRRNELFQQKNFKTRNEINT